jgi:Flp pilus assembly protein TadD
MTETRVEFLRRMVRDHPDDPRYRFGLAVECLNTGETREAVEALRAYLSMAEDEGNGWGRLGSALADLGDGEGAREAYQKGIDIALARGHQGLADELGEALENLP